ncbi:MAG: shikimate kinase [Actinobacteria bacterium]|nr:shikimate kinase [Actinomycetota bacterium]
MHSIILMGPPGSGKSTVGKHLSKELGLSFIDTDRLIEDKEGRSISEIFLADGEGGFRAIEKEIVLDVLKMEDCVIALGGGSVLDLDVQRELSECADVVFLDVSISNAAPRVGFNIYESLATRTVSTDNRKPNEVAHEIAQGVRK